MCTYIYTEKKISDCLITCILSNGEVIKYHKFILVVVMELSVRSLNTGPEDRLGKPQRPVFLLVGMFNGGTLLIDHKGQ